MRFNIKIERALRNCFNLRDRWLIKWHEARKRNYYVEADVARIQASCYEYAIRKLIERDTKNKFKKERIKNMTWPEAIFGCIVAVCLALFFVVIIIKG